MKKDDHYLVGSLLKTTGNKGEIILKFNNDLSDKILKLESILVEVDGKLVPFFIESLKKKSTTTVVVKIEGIDTELSSSEFINSKFYISEKQKDILEIEVSDFEDVKGYRVHDEKGNEIGTVLEFIDISQNPLLNLKTKNGEVVIPANDDLVIEVDDDEKLIVMIIPDGILDINES